VLDPAILQAVRESAWVVWLQAPVEVLAARVNADPKSAGRRPPLTSHDRLDELKEQLRIREPVYRAAADHVIDTADLAPAAVAQEIALFMKSAPVHHR
jgi:shikimate kinase